MADEEIIDYGFSLMTEDEVKRAEKELIDQKNSELTNFQEKVIGLKKMIWPFFEHLKTDSDKLYVFWPNRAQKIEELQRRIEAFLEEK
jgi:hypothetical protein